MPLKRSILTLEMAERVSSYVLKRGGWPDCTPEKILERANTFEELHKWMSIVSKSPSTPFPKNPKQSDVTYIAHDGISYCYLYLKGRWELVDAMPKRLR